jgi:glucose/arabinose dehydrogenase
LLAHLSLTLALIFLIGFVDHRSVVSSEDPYILMKPDLQADPIINKGKLGLSTGMAFLGPDDIIVTEKNTGKVKRVLNGNVLEDPLLDVTVSNQYERGLLGIAVLQDTNNGKRLVFLYYTEAEPNEQEDGSDSCTKTNKCEFRNPAGHRLYKYELEVNEKNKTEAKLVNPHLILDLPPNSGADHIGGAITIGPDRNIYVITGDGDSCQYSSCKYGVEHSVIDAQSANVREGDPPEGRGGIIRVTPNGQIVNGKGLLGDEHPLDMYYAYGIRNSFGMDFDPVTGNLWDTENGPNFGDEINLVEPGFNSGWMRTQGIWPITDSDLLSPDLVVDGYPDNLDSVGGIRASDLVDFDGSGNYSEPEFVSNRPIGVTAIKFLNSDKLGTDLQNDMFVGDINDGNLYHFDLTNSRKELHLEGSLKDKVADNMDELEQVIFAKGFGSITDIEVGPDGYLFILVYDGLIYRLVRS